MSDRTFIAEEKLLRRSARLFAIPSFLGGIASVLDVGATLKEYNQNATEQKADFESILSDWYAVGDDLRHSTITYVNKLPDRNE